MSDAVSEATLLDRLSRRGKLTVNARDGAFEVLLDTPGPYQGRSWCTTDEGDFWSHCHLGASDWRGEGTDLGALLAECEEASRPRHRDVDDLRYVIERRRETRTCGPPLPSYRRWHGWRPGTERWLRVSMHAHEYLAGYLRDLDVERSFLVEQAERDARRLGDELRRRRMPSRATPATPDPEGAQQ